MKLRDVGYGKSFLAIFLFMQLLPSRFLSIKLYANRQIFFFWSSEREIAIIFNLLPIVLRVSCFRLVKVVKHMSEPFFLWVPIKVFSTITHHTRAQRGKLCNTPPPKRLIQLTDDDRLTQMNEFFHFQFFPAFRFEREMCFGF